VDERAISLLQELRPLIKQRWEAQLRAEPVTSPLSNPDALVYLMDETLDQLAAAMHARSVKVWLRRHHAAVAPQCEKTICGLNPLLTYYITGRIALGTVAAERLGPVFADVMLFFHTIAQRDLEALCGVCCHQGCTTCPQRARVLEPERAAELLGR